MASKHLGCIWAYILDLDTDFLAFTSSLYLFMVHLYTADNTNVHILQENEMTILDLGKTISSGNLENRC